MTTLDERLKKYKYATLDKIDKIQEHLHQLRAEILKLILDDDNLDSSHGRYIDRGNDSLLHEILEDDDDQ